MQDSIISVNNVSKRYKLYDDIVAGPVKEYLFFWKGNKYYEEFWALKDASFEVREGEIVGIIGPNGAGKTTLLKMIAGLLRSDKGEITVKRKVTALLTLGVGFQPEFTGRENILYGGMLLGMSKKEVLRKTDSIIEFSELRDYIDRPFRTYSSGMKARLIFSTSMSIDPEILIVDEALATGDSHFVQKSSQRIKEICKSGATILFVSHDLYQIQQICHRVLLINEGRIIADGLPDDVIAQYRQLAFEKKKSRLPISAHRGLEMVRGTGEVVLRDVRLLNGKGEPDTAFYNGGTMKIELHYRRFNEKINKANLFIGLLDYKQNRYVGVIDTFSYINSSLENVKTTLKIDKQGVITVKVRPILLLTRKYSLWIRLYSTDDVNRSYSEYYNIKPFFVSRRDDSTRENEYFSQIAEFEGKAYVESVRHFSHIRDGKGGPRSGLEK